MLWVVLVLVVLVMTFLSMAANLDSQRIPEGGLESTLTDQYFPTEAISPKLRCLSAHLELTKSTLKPTVRFSQKFFFK